MWYLLHQVMKTVFCTTYKLDEIKSISIQLRLLLISMTHLTYGLDLNASKFAYIKYLFMQFCFLLMKSKFIMKCTHDLINAPTAYYPMPCQTNMPYL